MKTSSAWRVPLAVTRCASRYPIGYPATRHGYAGCAGYDQRASLRGCRGLTTRNRLLLPDHSAPHVGCLGRRRALSPRTQCQARMRETHSAGTHAGTLARTDTLWAALITRRIASGAGPGPGSRLGRGWRHAAARVWAGRRWRGVRGGGCLGDGEGEELGDGGGELRGWGLLGTEHVVEDAESALLGLPAHGGRTAARSGGECGEIKWTGDRDGGPG